MTDNGSKNGTFVNERRVSDGSCPLRHGDTIRFGYDTQAFLFLLPPGRGGDDLTPRADRSGSASQRASGGRSARGGHPSDRAAGVRSAHSPRHLEQSPRSIPSPRSNRPVVAPPSRRQSSQNRSPVSLRREEYQVRGSDATHVPPRDAADRVPAPPRGNPPSPRQRRTVAGLYATGDQSSQSQPAARPGTSGDSPPQRRRHRPKYPPSVFFTADGNEARDSRRDGSETPPRPRPTSRLVPNRDFGESNIFVPYDDLGEEGARLPPQEPVVVLPPPSSPPAPQTPRQSDEALPITRPSDESDVVLARLERRDDLADVDGRAGGD